MVYLAFFALPAGFSGAAALRGRPLPGTLRIASRADLSYRASFVTGFIPARKSRNFAVLRLIPKISAISAAVYPFILILSDCITKEFNKIAQKLHFTIHLFREIQKYFEKCSQKTSFTIDKKDIQGLQL